VLQCMSRALRAMHPQASHRKNSRRVMKVFGHPTPAASASLTPEARPSFRWGLRYPGLTWLPGCSHGSTVEDAVCCPHQWCHFAPGPLALSSPVLKVQSYEARPVLWLCISGV
jgi:hypothetical protein